MAELYMVGQSKTFNYTGNVQTIELYPGRYAFTCVGAKGGGSTGGKGGYVYGELTIDEPTIFNVYVGGAGGNRSGVNGGAGGWNGGGNGGRGLQSWVGGNGGGGATDIRKSGTSLNDRIIVAGGGGGGHDWNSLQGGYGGGTSGGNGQAYQPSSFSAPGGTQTSGYSKGQGQHARNGASTNNCSGEGGCGAGGGYYGGYSNQSTAAYSNCAGGGGSGYVSPIFVNINNTSNFNSGHGYATITCLELNLNVVGAFARFNYTGNVQSIKLRPGRYKLEVWGASGGSMAISPWTGKGGKGGYSSGEIIIRQTTDLFIYCGQQGQGYNGSTYHYGGWNGGGHCLAGASGGGGATDISLKNASWNSNDHLFSRIIVAGGGGGSNDHVNGGAGGGTVGNNGTVGNASIIGNGGTQTSGGTGWINGSFGIGGGSSNSHGDGGAGGGGWYGGGKANGNNAAGGGGSGYVYTKDTSNNYPAGCLLDESFYLLNTNMQSDINTGNGYAIITCLSIGYEVICIKDTGIGNIETNFENTLIQEGDIVILNAIPAPGYDFSHWSGDYTGQNNELIFMMVNETVTVTAHAIPRSDTKYKVNHYLADNKNNLYTLEDSFEYQGITDTLVTPPVIEYTGFKTPEEQTVSIDGSGNLVVDYYYLRDSFMLTVINGTSEKFEYLYGEIGNLEYTKMENVIETFKHWYSELSVNIYDATKKNTTFEMPPYDITIFVIGQPNRLNTNIYKNIFPEDVFNLEKIEKLKETTPTTLYDVTQEKHGFIIGNVLCYVNGKYQKALACNGPENMVVGIVTNVINENVFTLMSTGIYDWKQYNYEDTTILYLSDTFPGMLVHYNQIKSRIFVPVAVYIGNGQILMNIQDITIGAPMASYEKYSQNFDVYEKHELDEVIQHAILGVMSDEG